MNNDTDRRALGLLNQILAEVERLNEQQEIDYSRSTNGLVTFDDKPAAPRVNELARLGYDREWNK